MLNATIQGMPTWLAATVAISVMTVATEKVAYKKTELILQKMTEPSSNLPTLYIIRFCGNTARDRGQDLFSARRW